MLRVFYVIDVVGHGSAGSLLSTQMLHPALILEELQLNPMKFFERFIVVTLDAQVEREISQFAVPNISFPYCSYL